MGALVLVGYGTTYQPANFGRAYAAYGGVFIVMPVFWGWLVDGIRPHTSDVIGSLICLVGVGFIMYTPRT